MSEKTQKCFYCSNKAIAICDSCSPTSPTGLTKPKPLCADCIANGIGINILKFLIPEDEAEKAIRDATDKCCICGAKATISSEGGLYCHRCAMLHAK